MTEYIILKKIKTNTQANKAAREMGWDSDDDFANQTGGSLIGYWYTSTENSTTKKKGKKKLISPICIIVHGRLFDESMEGYEAGDTAYVKFDDYMGLF